LGLAHMDAGEHDRAGRQFRAIVDGDSDHLEALQNLGATQVAVGSFADALITYSALADKRPDDASVQLTIGSLLTRMGRREEAQRGLKLACERGIAEACR
jgi:Flp pilus assembly protein TadD